MVEEFEHPVIASIGAGDGGLLKSLWKKPKIVKTGVELNHEIITEGKVTV